MKGYGAPCCDADLHTASIGNVIMHWRLGYEAQRTVAEHAMAAYEALYGRYEAEQQRADEAERLVRKCRPFVCHAMRCLPADSGKPADLLTEIDHASARKDRASSDAPSKDSAVLEEL